LIGNEEINQYVLAACAAGSHTTFEGLLMPIGTAYQVVKDLIALAKMKEAEPIDSGNVRPTAIGVVGIDGVGNGSAYS
jgi:hypothetical protein